MRTEQAGAEGRERRGRRWVQVVGSLIALGALVEVALLIAVCACAARAYAPAEADCAIVLGARVWPDGAISNSLQYRLEAALSAHSDGRAPKIIVTGARGGDEPMAEAEAARRWLLDQGVSDADILVEDKSYDTLQNLENAREIMAANGLRTALIVTSDYHLTRAMWIAGDVGIEARALPARSPQKPVTWWTGHIRETVSWVLYAVDRIAG